MDTKKERKKKERKHFLNIKTSRDTKTGSKKVQF